MNADNLSKRVEKSRKCDKIETIIVINEEVIMSVQYNKLFHLMIDQKMSNSELVDKAGISLNIMTRLKRDEYVSLETIEKICIALNCKVDDILQFNRE